MTYRKSQMQRSGTPWLAMFCSVWFLAVPARGWGSEQVFMVDGTRSHLIFSGHSTGHDFQGQTTAIAGRFGYDQDRMIESGFGEVHIPVTSIKTGNAARDANMYKHLDVEHYPEILFQVRRLAGAPQLGTSRFSGKLIGELSIKGVTKEIPLHLTITSGEPQQLAIRGTAALRMSDFNIEPPGFLFFRVEDEVQVDFQVIGKAQ
ncbi:MAG: YceI family protein [Candidatus Binatia bacterium]